jgi:hypothetical protein
VAIGVVAIPNPDYDSEHWWRYSEGVERVIENDSLQLQDWFSSEGKRAG